MMQPDFKDLKELLSAVKTVDSALLFCHISPDGDTLGSALALKIRLERMGISTQVAVGGEIPRKLARLPGADEILLPGDEPKPFTAAIAVDVSDEMRLGSWLETYRRGEKQLVIDHHGTNPLFGQVNAVDGDAPATAILIWQLFSLTEYPLTEPEALCLYTALSTDTGNFIYKSTTPEAFRMMGELREAIQDFESWSRLLFREKEIPFLLLLKSSLQSLTFFANGRGAGISLTQDTLRLCGANDTHRDGLVDYAIDAEGVQVAYLASETADGKTKFSLRSKVPLRVDLLAKALGGGGHGQAAGVTLPLPLPEAEKKIRQLLEELLTEAKA